MPKPPRVVLEDSAAPPEEVEPPKKLRREERLEARPTHCGPGLTAVPGLEGRPYCRATYGGFGGTLHNFHGHGHAHGGHGGGHGHGGG